MKRYSDAFKRLRGLHGAPLPPYSVRCQMLGLESTESRRVKAQALFVAGLLLGRIDAPNLLSLIHFYVPTRSLRSRDPLFLPTRRRVFSYHDPILVCIRQFNRFYPHFDFNISLSSFRSRLTPAPPNVSL